jgi:serine/threonine protein kinase
LNKDKWFFSLHASGFISIEFERETVLGKGGYGTVFREEWNNKRVAVKRIKLSKWGKKNKGEEALQKLEHPNVANLFHVESDPNFR